MGRGIAWHGIGAWIGAFVFTASRLSVGIP